METICLNKTALASNGLSLGETLLLLIIHNKIDLNVAQKPLIDKGFITAERDDLFQANGWRITNLGAKILDNALSDSLSTVNQNEPSKNELEVLAAELKEIFPRGKKLGTNSYWAEGPALIAKRLKKFFQKYGNKYTSEQVIDAARRYVQSFNGDYTYMRVLKYFIWKEAEGAGGDIESTSDLYNMLIHSGQEEADNGRNWRDKVR